MKFSNMLRRSYIVPFAAAAGFANAAESWEAPVVVSSDVTANGGRPSIAVHRGSRWSAVWQRDDNSLPRTSLSTNNAINWQAAAPLPVPGGYENLGLPVVTADVTSGTFISAWNARVGSGPTEVSIGRMRQNETTYTLQGFPISYNDGGNSGMNQPALASGVNQVFLLGGSAPRVDLADGEVIALYRSVDNGASWLFEAALGLDGQTHKNVATAGDTAGNFVALWERSPSSSSTAREIYFTRSIDSGDNWSLIAPVNASSPAGREPAVVTSASGGFVAAYVTGTSPANLVSYRTTNSGVTWAGPVIVNATGADGRNVQTAAPAIACDGQGTCVAVWSGVPGGSTRRRLYYATSLNNGANWSASEVLTSSTLDVSDELPQVQYDGAGRWVAAWQRTTFSGSSSRQILSSRLVFPVRADLSVSQVDEPDPAKVGEEVTFSITVRNDGPSTATNVIATDTLPTSSAVRLSQSQGTSTQTTGSVVFNIGTMSPGGTATAEVVVQLPATGRYQNVVSLTNMEADIDTSDRISTATTSVLVNGIDLQGKWEQFSYKSPRNVASGRLRIDGQLEYSNFGNRRSVGAFVLFVLSDDEFLSDDDPVVQFYTVDPIGPGKSRILKFNRHLRRHVPWQGRHLIAILDCERRIEEADETNNLVISPLLD